MLKRAEEVDAEADANAQQTSKKTRRKADAGWVGVAVAITQLLQTPNAMTLLAVPVPLFLPVEGSLSSRLSMFRPSLLHNFAVPSHRPAQHASAALCCMLTSIDRPHLHLPVQGMGEPTNRPRADPQPSTHRADLFLSVLTTRVRTSCVMTHICIKPLY